MFIPASADPGYALPLQTVQWFMCSASRLMVLYICVKFRENFHAQPCLARKNLALLVILDLLA